MIRNGLSCLVLGVGGAALATSVAPVTTAAVVGALMSGAAGGYLQKTLDTSQDRLIEAIFHRHPGIDENHHILHALRQAHLKALDQVLKNFDAARASMSDPESRREAKRFSQEAKKFLKDAGLGGKTGQGPPSQFEEEVFSGLPDAFSEALAARGRPQEGSTEGDAQKARNQIEADVLAELLHQTATSAPELPALFRSSFIGRSFEAGHEGQDGWFDLFVRDAAARLKTDENFRSIWVSEKLAGIEKDINAGFKNVDAGFKAQADAAKRYHQFEMAKMDEILAAATRDKGIGEEKLRPIVERLGHTDAKFKDFPELISRSVDVLLARAALPTEFHNDAAAIDAAINEARQMIAAENFDVSGAISLLEKALEDEDAYERALKAEDEARNNRMAIGAGKARAHFELAFIKRATFDHEGAIASMEGGLQLDPDNYIKWTELGDEFVVVGSSAKALAAFEAAKTSIECSGDDHDLSVIVDRIGDVQVVQGDLSGGLASFQAGLVIAERLAKADPGNADWQRDLSVSHNKIGDVQVAQGDLSGGLASFKAGLAIAERLAKDDPGNAGWQRDLSVSHDRIGDVQVAQGDLSSGIASFKSGLVIRERLAKDDPGNAGLQRNLSVSHNKIGDIQVAQGDLSGGLASFEAGLVIAERLAKDDPGNAGWQRDLSVSHDRIGDVQVAQGDLSGGLASFKAGQVIAERLAKDDPGNAGLQRDLSVSHNRIGDIQVAQGDLSGGLASFEAGLVIAERLAKDDPGNAGWQRDLSVSHDRIGDVQVAQGDLSGGLASFQAGLAIAERLAKDDPGNAGWQRDLSVSHDRIGDVQVAQGDLSSGIASFKSGLVIRERLAKDDPGNAGWQRDLSVSHNKIGDVQVAQGDLSGGLASFKADLVIVERLAKDDPGNAVWQRDLIVSYVKLSDCGSDDAKTLLQKALHVAQNLQQEGRLNPVDSWMPEDLARRIGELEA